MTKNTKEKSEMTKGKIGAIFLGIVMVVGIILACMCIEYHLEVVAFVLRAFPLHKLLHKSVSA